MPDADFSEQSTVHSPEQAIRRGHHEAEQERGSDLSLSTRPDELPAVVTIPEAARLAEVSEKTIRRRIAADRLTPLGARRPGEPYRLSRDQVIEQFLAPSQHERSGDEAIDAGAARHRAAWRSLPPKQIRGRQDIE